MDKKKKQKILKPLSEDSHTVSIAVISLKPLSEDFHTVSVAAISLKPLSEDFHTVSIVAISQVADSCHINRCTHTNPSG